MSVKMFRALRKRMQTVETRRLVWLDEMGIDGAMNRSRWIDAPWECMDRLDALATAVQIELFSRELSGTSTDEQFGISYH